MFENKSINDCEIKMKTNVDRGLDEKQAKERLKRNGFNKLEESKKKSLIKTFFLQMNDPMIYILFVSTIISICLGEFSDAIIIVIVVLVNAFIGTIQEHKADKALEALKKMSIPTCYVKRNGIVKEIESKELVVGDIVEISAGKFVPADLRITESHNLKIEESALTGESAPVGKDANVVLKEQFSLGDRINMAYMGTNVVCGRGRGIVVATGMNTEIGKIAKMLKHEKNDTTPLQKKLSKLGEILGYLTLVICGVLCCISIMQGKQLIRDGVLLNGISLAVAAIPEGMPAVVTIVLALGVQKMTKVNAIVRKLPSVETLGSVNVICSDKTGTLTQNKMEVKRIYEDGKLKNEIDAKKSSLLIEGMVLCNDASNDKNNSIGDPTEIALINLGLKNNIEKNKIEQKYKRIKEIPFDSNRKMMSTQHVYENYKRIYTKGALDNVLEKCNKILENGEIRKITKEDIEKIKSASHEMTCSALRVLSLAYNDCEELEEKNLIFIGMVGMIDPPRKEVKESIQKIKEAGVTTVMITGDHVDTAFAIAKELDITNEKSQCLSGEDLEKMSQNELNKRINNVRVFARVSPQHKAKIVKAFKANDKIVAMTGDGVNDAPSLKAADIGIAMGLSGTDVAKNAADMVLNDDNFATIEKAIEEGRTIYANIRKSVLFLLSSNFAEIITMFIAIILGMPTPLIAVHVLWINLLTDSIPALALGSDPKEDDVMQQKPRDKNESLFSNGGMKCTIVYGVLIGFVTILAFVSVPIANLRTLNLKINFNSIVMKLKEVEILKKAQTFAFTTLAISELLHAIGMRNIEKSFIRKEFFNNKLMLASVMSSILLQLAVTEIPFLNSFFKTTNLKFAEWLYLLGLSFVVLIAHEIWVMAMYIKRKHSQK